MVPLFTSLALHRLAHCGWLLRITLLNFYVATTELVAIASKGLHYTLEVGEGHKSDAFVSPGSAIFRHVYLHHRAAGCEKSANIILHGVK